MAQGSITYEGDGEREIFFIPFPYGDVGRDVGASEIAGGLERELEFGADWQCVEHSVCRLVPAGATLRIYLKAPLARVRRLAEARAKAARELGVCEAGAMWAARDACEAAEDAAKAAKASAEKAAGEIAEAAAQAVAGARAELGGVAQNALDVAAAGCQLVGEKAAAAGSVISRKAADAIARVDAAGRGALANAAFPGLTAVRDKSGFALANSGFYLVLPPCPEAGPLGLFPVEHKDKAQWDGFFVILPGCPGHVDMSGFEEPGDGGGAGEAGGQWWQPCRHEHVHL